MRARNIKPGFFKNEVLAEMPTEHRLLFIGLWTLADREGRLEDRPKRIKMEVFAYDSFDVDSMLNELQKHNFLLRYSVEEEKYLQIMNFVKHQDPHYKEKASEIPPAPGLSDIIKAKAVGRLQRARILERDGYLCQSCGEKNHLCIDHVIPASRGGSSEDDNLQVLCISCNTKKGNKIEETTLGKKKSKHNQESTLTRFNFDSTSIQKDCSKTPFTLIPDSQIPDSVDDDCASAPNFFEKLQTEINSPAALNMALVESWTAQGLSDDLIFHTVQVVMDKKRKSSDPSPPNSMKYFNLAMAVTLKALTEPLPEIKNVPINRQNNTGNRQPTKHERTQAALAKYLEEAGLIDVAAEQFGQG